MTPMRRIFVEKRVALVFVGILALALAAALVYGGGVLPQRRGIAVAQVRAEAAARGLATGETELAVARARRDGKSHADDELEQFYRRVLPQDLAGARSITYPRLAALASEIGLNLERRTSDRGQEDESELGRLRTTMLLAGEYADVRHFIEALETAPEFLVIDEIVLTQREDDDESSLALTLGVSTYYRAASSV